MRQGNGFITDSVAGCRAVSDLFSWQVNALDFFRKKLISIDFEPAEVDSDFPLDVDIVSNLSNALWQMNEELNNHFDGNVILFDINKRKKP